MTRFLPPTFAAMLLLISQPSRSAAETSADVFIYGGTPGGVAAAVTSARAGHKVVLAEPGYFVGGMMAGGLTKTDVGNRETLGGISKEFFDRVFDFYKTTYGADSLQARQSHQGVFFEPKVAAAIFRAMLDEAGVSVLLKHRLDAVKQDRERILSATLAPAVGGPVSVTAKIFIDATYEGDLLAAAGVPYRVGREAREEYQESLAGMTDGPAMYLGKGDHRVQAYNIRSTITNRPDILVPFPKPETYTPEPHQGFIQAVKKHGFKTFEDLFHDVPMWGEVNGKLDPNKADAVGMNFNYAEADPEGRARIVRRVQDYWLSLWYMLQTDPELPQEFRDSVKKWGLPKDEFTESGHVSPQIYVRVARRMLGRHMLTQNDVQDERFKDDAICLGSYNIDSHDVQRLITPKGWEMEGYIIQATDPYEIPYRSITPFAPENLLVVCAVSATHIAYGTLRMEPVFLMIGQAAGIAADLAITHKTSVQDIPVKTLQDTLRKTGIALAAPFRPKIEIVAQTPPPYAPGQEIVFEAKTVRGRSPLEKISWNFDGSGAVQATGPTVRHRFSTAKPVTISANAIDQEGHQALLATKDLVIGENGTPDIEVPFSQAATKGRWDRAGSGSVAYRFRTPYHDMNDGKGEKSATFSATIPADGTYIVAMAFAEDSNRAQNVPVSITHASGTTNTSVDQSAKTKPFAFVPLGSFPFKKGEKATVTVGNAGTKGYVVVDAVRWIRSEETTAP